MRALAHVPLVLDSIRARSRVVTDQATCARLWLALDKHDRGPRIAVVQIGQTFWTRSADGMTAFDNAYRWIGGFVDQWAGYLTGVATGGRSKHGGWPPIPIFSSSVSKRILSRPPAA